MERIAFTLHLLPDTVEEYRRRHDALWPELAELLREAGDREALAHHQSNNDALMASETLKAAFRTDVSPVLARARLLDGGAIDPVAAYRLAGYRDRVTGERPAVTGGGGGIV